MEDDWGEDGVRSNGGVKRHREDEEGEDEAVDSTSNRGCTKRPRFAPMRSKSTTITEYFKSTSSPIRRMSDWLGTEEDQAAFAEDFGEMS